ncbi:hypothetical protein LCGC14_1952190 [marine sediment metagenome]|uniref:Uncharacterized protein n=1 Tax=marine sediment metagenome TaxID=412755 RepID=A0A0F9IE66_9ZZZZ
MARKVGARAAWWVGAVVAFGLPMEAFAGIMEGGANGFYNTSVVFPILAFGVGVMGVAAYWFAVPRKP